MEMDNSHTLLTSFVLVGFTADPFLRMVLFVLFLVSYTLSLTGNIGLVALIYLDSQLHTPMYIFVGNFSFLDVWYSSVYTPQIVSDCVSKNNIISLAGCAAQLFFSCGLVYSECFLLVTMAYDHFVAICNPLVYATAMPRNLCIQLVVGSYVAGFANAIIHTGNIFRLRFCGNSVINHFFCDVPPLVEMACDSTEVYEIIMATIVGCTMTATTVLILDLYTRIVAAIMRTHSSTGRSKAFSTCSTHLLSVFLFYGSILLMYSRPSSMHMPAWDKLKALFYTVFNPLVNPLIYSLRNKDVKAAFKNVLKRLITTK